MKVTIELTEQQAGVMMTALETFSRIQMGQIDTVAARIFSTIDSKKFEQLNMRAIGTISDALKLLLFPELTSVHSYHGIDSKNIHESARTSWDIYQTIRHALLCADDPTGKIETYGSPMQIGKEPLPKIHVEIDE